MTASLGVVAIAGGLLFGQVDTAGPDPSSSQGIHEVTVGIYVNQINTLNLRDNQFTADCNVWFRWKGEGIDPLESFELINGKTDAREKEIRTKIGDENYATCRIVATFTQFWDISAFPLDSHNPEIAIEDQIEDHKFRYVADTENSALNSAALIPGWAIGIPRIAVVTHTYSTNYGDTSLPTGHASSYSRFCYTIPLKRPGYGYSLKLLLGLLVATALGFAMFFVRPIEDPRFNLGVGAVFATVASEYIVAACLPATHILTLADVLHMLALVFIFLAIAESILSLKLFRRGMEQASARLDRWSFVVLGSAFVVLCVVLAVNYCRQPVTAMLAGS